MSVKKSRFIDILNGNLWIDILRFIGPYIASSLFQLVFNTLDSVIVGKFDGDVANAAISSSNTLLGLMFFIFTGLSIGLVVILSDCVGKGDYKKVRKVIHNSVLIALYGGIILAILGFTVSKPLLMLFGSPDDTIDKSALYMGLYLSGSIGDIFNNFGNGILRVKGDTKRPMLFQTIGGIFNTAVCALITIVFKNGVVGMGVGIAVAHMVSGGLIFLSLLKDESVYSIDFKELKFDFDALKDMFTVGTSCGLQSVAYSLSNSKVQGCINMFGSDVMAGSGAASTIEGFLYVFTTSLYQACSTFVGQNFSAKKYKRVKDSILICVIYEFLIGGTVSILSVVFSRQLIGIYSSSNAVIEYGMTRLKIVGSVYFLDGLLEIGSGILRGCGYSTAATVNSLLGGCAFRLVYLYTYFEAHPVVENVYLAYPFTWIFTITLHWVYFFIKIKDIKKNCSSV